MVRLDGTCCSGRWSKAASGVTARAASKAGHFALLKWAVARGCPWKTADCLMDACSRGVLDEVLWTVPRGKRGRGVPQRLVVLQTAALGGSCELVQCLRNRGFAWNAETCSAAALNGPRFAVVQSERLRLGRRHFASRGNGRPHGNSAVGDGAGLSVR